MANPAARLVPRFDALANLIRESWDRLENIPGGKALFSRLVGLAAPYSATIGASVVELGKGHAKVIMKDRRGLRNHLSSVHAVALVNLAELTGNVALGYSMPDDARFIVAGLSIEYLKKARGTITGTVSCPVPETAERMEYEVPVELRDEAGDLVARAVLQTLVGPKKKKKS
jgi:acyl-coenzyme A thioesterase PaaI-like protein